MQDKTYRERWTIETGVKIGSRRSVLEARHDDDHHIKAKIDNTQKNCKSRLFGEKPEIINHIINGCSKLTQKEKKTRQDWVGKVNHWEQCKKLKFDHIYKERLYNRSIIQSAVFLGFFLNYHLIGTGIVV